MNNQLNVVELWLYELNEFYKMTKLTNETFTVTMREKMMLDFLRLFLSQETKHSLNQLEYVMFSISSCVLAVLMITTISLTYS